MKCRGCGLDTRDTDTEVGWMHFECEIKRLTELLEEERAIAAGTDAELSQLREHCEELKQYLINANSKLEALKIKKDAELSRLRQELAECRAKLDRMDYLTNLERELAECRAQLKKEKQDDNDAR